MGIPVFAAVWNMNFQLSPELQGALKALTEDTSVLRRHLGCRGFFYVKHRVLNIGTFVVGC